MILAHHRSDNLFFNSMLVSMMFHILLFIVFPYLQYQIREKPPIEIIQVEISDFGSIPSFKNFSSERRVMSPKSEKNPQESKNAVIESRNPENLNQQSMKMMTEMSQAFFKDNPKNISVLNLHENIKTPDIMPEEVDASLKKIDLTTAANISQPRKAETERLNDPFDERQIKLTNEENFVENLSRRDNKKSPLVMPVPESLTVNNNDNAMKIPNEIKGRSDSIRGSRSGESDYLPPSSGFASQVRTDDINLPMNEYADGDKSPAVPEGVVPASQGNRVDREADGTITKVMPTQATRPVGNRAIIYDPVTRMPPWAEKQGINTRFRAKIMIAPNGSVTEVRLLTKTGFAELDNLAIEHIKKILYEPYSEFSERIIEVDLITK